LGDCVGRLPRLVCLGEVPPGEGHLPGQPQRFPLSPEDPLFTRKAEGLGEQGGRILLSRVGF
jgi:hypothetical protein